MSTRPYRAIVFDLDGTLVDSYDALLRSVNAVLQGEGARPIDRETLRSFVGEGVERLLERCFQGAVPPEAGLRFEEEYDRLCCEGSLALPEVESTLHLLSANGTVMGVCTNKPTRFSAKILEALRIAHHFAAITGPDLAGTRKPDPRHVHHVLAAIGAVPEEALFVGDMPIDVEAARASGVAVAVIATGSSSLEALREARPDYHLERFSDLLALAGPMTQSETRR